MKVKAVEMARLVEGLEWETVGDDAFGELVFWNDKLFVVNVPWWTDPFKHTAALLNNSQ